MKTKHAKQIREGILLARQVIRHERIGPYKKSYSRDTRDLTQRAYIRTIWNVKPVNPPKLKPRPRD